MFESLSALGLIGLFLLIMVATRPGLFWPALLVVVISTGPIVIHSQSWIDEFLVICLVCGVYVALAMRKTRLCNKKADLSKWHNYAFNMMITYMCYQSVRGIIATGSLLQIRWVVYFILLGMISYLFQRYEYQLPSIPKTALIISWAGLVYYISYCSIGLLAPYLFRLDHDEIQNLYWGGSTYAAFPMVIILPSLLILSRQQGLKAHKLVWSTLGLMIFASMFYSSRISWIALFVFFMVSFRRMGVVRTAAFASIFVLFLGIALEFFFPEYYTAGIFAQMVYDPFIHFLTPQAEESISDLGRTAHIRMAFSTISSSPVSMLIGHGLRTSGDILGPHLARFFWDAGNIRLARAYMVYDNIATNTITALVTETGCIGLLLLASNFYFVARRIFRERSNPWRGALLASLGLTGFWMTVTNVMDIALCYMLLMPSGLLIYMSKYREVPRS